MTLPDNEPIVEHQSSPATVPGLRVVANIGHHAVEGIEPAARDIDPAVRMITESFISSDDSEPRRMPEINLSTISLNKIGLSKQRSDQLEKPAEKPVAPPEQRRSGITARLEQYCRSQNLDLDGIVPATHAEAAETFRSFVRQDVLAHIKAIRAQTDRPASALPAPILPEAYVKRKLQHFYQKFDPRSHDIVAEGNRHTYLQSFMDYADHYQRQFLEIKAAQMLRADFLTLGHTDAAEVAMELHAAYGATLDEVIEIRRQQQALVAKRLAIQQEANKWHRNRLEDPED